MTGVQTCALPIFGGASSLRIWAMAAVDKIAAKIASAARKIKGFMRSVPRLRRGRAPSPPLRPDISGGAVARNRLIAAAKRQTGEIIGLDATEPLRTIRCVTKFRLRGPLGRALASSPYRDAVATCRFIRRI